MPKGLSVRIYEHGGRLATKATGEVTFISQDTLAQVLRMGGYAKVLKVIPEVIGNPPQSCGRP